MDPLNKINVDTDSTIALIRKALHMGIDVWVTTPNAVSFKENRAEVNAQFVQNNDLKLNFYTKHNLDYFDYCFIRQDPPFDINYLTNLYLLEIHNQNYKKPFFVNNPSGIKNFTEKIFPFYFESLTPYSVISCEEKIFSNMLDEFGAVVLKTLYNKGGKGIYKVTKFDKKGKKLFQDITNNFNSQIVIQEFIDDVIKGDKRILLINGKAEGVVNRIPKPGQFKANLHLGGRAEKTFLTKQENQICKKLSSKLIKHKLFFVGIDVINEKLTEVNVTSPTGIVQIENLYGIDFCEIFWKKLLEIRRF